MDKSADQLLGQYFEKLPEALLKFQFIEESLRIYIAYCYQIISLRIPKEITFKYGYNDLQKDSLGTLLRKFKKFSANDLLIQKLGSIVKDRNYCAHQAYLLTYKQQKNPGYLAAEIRKMGKIIAKAESCRELLSAELSELERIKNRIYKSKD
jgi:hypothetical protein